MLTYIKLQADMPYYHKSGIGEIRTERALPLQQSKGSTPRLAFLIFNSSKQRTAVLKIKEFQSIVSDFQFLSDGDLLSNGKYMPKLR
jgi:hypothetical protein